MKPHTLSKKNTKVIGKKRKRTIHCTPSSGRREKATARRLGLEKGAQRRFESPSSGRGKLGGGEIFTFVAGQNVKK